jgi:hypothetical protein
LRRALIPVIFVLILTFHTLNIQRSAGIENTNSVIIAPSDSVREGERNHNNSREVYRDGIIDNFENFTNPGFPTEHDEYCVRYGNTLKTQSLRIIGKVPVSCKSSQI